MIYESQNCPGYLKKLNKNNILIWNLMDKTKKKDTVNILRNLSYLKKETVNRIAVINKLPEHRIRKTRR